MGLFDYVRSEIPLPDGYVGALQTKHFDEPYMLTHVISKDGRLMQCVLLRTELVPKVERPYPNEPDDSFLSLAGSLRSVTEMRDANYHGMFYFGYGSDHEYVAKFTDGQLVAIQQAPRS